MRDLIIEKLKTVEKEENVRILLAVESGSRAWGFASPDSDYDVRFIYARPVEAYLRLDTVTDVIEMPINDLLAINGWDICKTLRLLYRSNPTLFEWVSSPVVYIDTGFRERIQAILPKYFYVLRPVLACKWILDRHTPPPMRFSDLADAELDPSLKPEVDRLLDIKMNVPELKLIPRVDAINRYLDESIEQAELLLDRMGDEQHNDWDELNRLFLEIIGH